jgi:hypothetical protein
MRWLEIGRDESERADTDDLPLTFYRHFWQAVKRAEAVPEMRALETIRLAGARGGWRASAWFLERRYPDTWGPKATSRSRERSGHRGTSESLSAVSGADLEAKVLRILGQRGA